MSIAVLHIVILSDKMVNIQLRKFKMNVGVSQTLISAFRLKVKVSRYLIQDIWVSRL